MCLAYTPGVTVPVIPTGQAAWVPEPKNVWTERELKVCIRYGDDLYCICKHGNAKRPFHPLSRKP